MAKYTENVVIPYGVSEDEYTNGLTVIDWLDFGGSYEFHQLVVWKHEDGRVLYGTDSGCSCPIPFEDHTISDLTEVTRENWSEFEKIVKKFGTEQYRYPPSSADAEKTELLSKVSREVFK